MSKRKKAVMNMLTDLAEKDVDAAAEALAQAMQQVEAAQKQYDMLQNYYKDYKSNFENSLQQGMGMHEYQNFQRFFTKLDMAIQGQFDVLNANKADMLACKQAWLTCQRKKVSYDVLHERHDAQALQIERKKDQQQTDEFAMRNAFRQP